MKVQHGADGSATDVSTASPLPVTLANTGANATAVKVDNSAVTQPISGTVSLSATDNAVLDDIAAQTSAASVAAEGAALASGILIQGDDGTDRKNINVDATTGDVQVDITHTVTVDGSGVTQPISGTVTANLSATDNAVLDQIEVNTSYGDNTGGGTEANSLRVTLATDSTGVLSVDDNGSSLTVDNGGTFATQATLQAGSASIGTLGANSGVDIGDVDVTSQPARAATTDNTGAALMTNVMQDGTTALTPKFAIIDAALSGNNTLVAAVVGKKIRVLSLMAVSAGTVTTRFESGAGGTALSGQMNLVVNSGFTLPFNPIGWFETANNTLLNLELSGAISVDGLLTYVEV